MQVAVFRWKAAVPLLAFGALGAAAWLLFAERIARRAIETVGTAVIGAKVEIRALALSLGHGSVAVRGLTVASPFRPLENLLQADELVADLDLLPLLEKKVVIDRLAAKGLKFATPRATDGRTRRQAGGLMDQVEHCSSIRPARRRPSARAPTRSSWPGAPRCASSMLPQPRTPRSA